jgi:hypothetical protein
MMSERYKRVDVVVDAATKAGLGLDLLRNGPLVHELKQRAGPTVTFHGSVADETLVELMQRCRALCLPGIEDFGITAVEAHAGGSQSSHLAPAEPGNRGSRSDGCVFRRHTIDDFLQALHDCEALATDSSVIEGGTAIFSASFSAEDGGYAGAAGPRLILRSCERQDPRVSSYN